MTRLTASKAARWSAQAQKLSLSLLKLKAETGAVYLSAKGGRLQRIQRVRRDLDAAYDAVDALKLSLDALKGEFE